MKKAGASWRGLESVCKQKTNGALRPSDWSLGLGSGAGAQVGRQWSQEGASLIPAWTGNVPRAVSICLCYSVPH